MARRATRAHRTLYLLFCSCSTRSLTHWEQNCNLKSLGSVLTGAPRTERYRYLDLRGNQILASEMSKHVFCWAELAQLCPHDIVRTSCKASAMQGKKHTCRQECNEISRNLLQAPSLMLSYYCHRIVFGWNQVDFFANKHVWHCSSFLSKSFVFEAILLRYLTHGENRGKEMTSRRRFATPQINWLFKRGRRGKDMFLIQLFVNLNNCQ